MPLKTVFTLISQYYFRSMPFLPSLLFGVMADFINIYDNDIGLFLGL